MNRNEPDALGRIRAEHRHLAVLRCLARMPGYCSNERLLSGWLDALGIVSSYEEVRRCLRELDDFAAITVKVEGSMMVVTLTRRGGEISEGRTVVDGVLKPEPECPY